MTSRAGATAGGGDDRRDCLPQNQRAMLAARRTAAAPIAIPAIAPALNPDAPVDAAAALAVGADVVLAADVEATVG